MDKKPLISKYVAVGIIFLFVTSSILPATGRVILVTEKTMPIPENFFGLGSNIEISWDVNQTKEPIIPRGELRTVDLGLSFWVTWGKLGRLINYIFRGAPVRLGVSIIDKPEWCAATLSQGTLFCNIPPPKENSHQIVHTRMSVQVADVAPAFELCPVTIQAIIEPLHGPFGFLTMMQGTIQIVNVTFTVAYYPLVSFSFPDTNIIETPPLVQVDFRIRMQNLGNGKTIVENEVVHYPDDWDVYIPSQVVLDVYESKEINATILAPYNFSGEETITLLFTPHSYDNYSLVGSPTLTSILAYYNPLRCN